MKVEREAFPLSLAAERRLDRRRFLCTAGAAAVLAVAGEWLGRRIGATSPAGPGISLADVGPLAAGEARAVRLPGRTAEVLVVRVDPGTVVAFERRCPHLGCPVLWAAERGRFECPCHDAAFDARTGHVLFGPPRRGLTPIGVEEEG